MNYRTEACCIGLLAVFALAACGGSPPPTPGRGTVPPTASAGLSLDQVMSQKIPPGILNTALQSASNFQKKLLADGYLTPAEYESAVLAFVACVRSHGMGIKGDIRLNGMYRYDFMITWRKDEPNAQKFINDCNTEYRSAVDDVWLQMTESLQARVIGESEQFAADCLRQKGFTPDQASSNSASPAAQSAYNACVTATQSRFDLGHMFFGARDTLR